MNITLDSKVVAKYPQAAIGYIIADVNVAKTSEYTENLKKSLKATLDKLGITAENYADYPMIKGWQQVFKDFVTPENTLEGYTSSVEALVKRVVKNEKLWSISTVVDLYNACSVLSLMPMGAYDLDKIEGNITIRFGKKGEKIAPLGSQEDFDIAENQVVYADDKKVTCWLWNYRDSKLTGVDLKTKRAIFFIDAATSEQAAHLKEALECLMTHLTALGADIKEHGVLNAQNIHVKLPEVIAKKSQENISSEYAVRVGKVEELAKKSLSAWPALKPVTATTAQVVRDYEEHEASPEKSLESYAIAGRVMAKREHGKAIFATIQDRSGHIQIYLKLDKVGAEQFEFFKAMIDLGDIVWCTGTPFRTRTGEITLELSEFSLLSKSLHPLPEKFHGLTDVETKYRQRYLDLMTSRETRERFVKRSKIIQEMRQYLQDHEFIEVETPMLHPIPGGAAARPFVTHHNALNADLYLRIAPELYLKRLVIGGFERVFEINRNFRNEGISTRHNPEFTMLEMYMAYQDYRYIMGFIEDLFRKLALHIVGSLQVPFGNYTLDFEQPFMRINMAQALVLYGGLQESDITPENIDSTLRKHAIKTANSKPSHAEKIYALFEELVESKLIQPTFIIDFPIEVSPLAKRDSENPNIAARFELFIAGMEISNGFTELNDPFDQADRFKQQVAAHAAGDEEAHRFDADYIQALEYGLPPTVGVGIGIDRLVMLLTNTTSIKEVILFPALKKKQEEHV